MGLISMLRNFLGAVDGEYERRIKAASQVKRYRVGGHGHAGDHDADHGAAAAELGHEVDHHAVTTPLPGGHEHAATHEQAHH